MKKIILIILGILFLIILAGMFKFNYLANLDDYDVDGNKMEIKKDVKVDGEGEILESNVDEKEQDFTEQNPAEDKDAKNLKIEVEKIINIFSEIMPFRDFENNICHHCGKNIISEINFIDNETAFVGYSDGHNCMSVTLKWDNKTGEYLADDRKITNCEKYQGESVYKYIIDEEKPMIILIPKLEFSEKIDEHIIEFSRYEYKRTPAILNAVYKKLFELRAGNYADSKWDGLQFDSVSIKNKIATVKLIGSWYPAGDMSGLYFSKEIEAAAFQFDSVSEIKVLVNEEIFDWCIDDESDGENGCPEEKRLWIRKKY